MPDCQEKLREFWENFQTQRQTPLNLTPLKETSPFQEQYLVLKKYTLEILNKNARFALSPNLPNNDAEVSPPSLSVADLDFVQAQLLSGVSTQTKFLEKNLYLLSTIVTLAPFLGLLGTVWGILTTFSEMQSLGGMGGQTSMLSGLSLALATTVIGLLDAIPALIGYNYLKNTIRDFQTDMESCSNEMLASVELQYRRVDAN